jgi:hypothetical protein
MRFLGVLTLYCWAAPTSVESTSAAIAAFKQLDYRFFVAGGTCAAISHGITTPIDVVRYNSTNFCVLYNAKYMINRRKVRCV